MDDASQKQLEAVFQLFRERGLEELLIEEGSIKVHLRTGRRDLPPRGTASAPAGLLPRPGQREKRGRTVAVRSPLIGVFYRAPSADAPPYVEIGDLVEEGQTVCIVEAMKVLNEIKAEWRGRVVAVPAENGKLVQAGEPLVVLEFLPEAAQAQEGG